MAMTDNHKELCERLRDQAAFDQKQWGARPGNYVPIAGEAADLIEQQADRIAELEKERDAILSKVKSTLVHERSLYLSKWKREAITACIERVAALQAEKETRS